MTERVRVVVRIRPFIASDPPDAELNTVVLDRTHVSVGHHRVFKVDRVFMMEDGSDDIYKESVAPLVDRFIGGCNAGVLAYGQTGTGKTYTVQTILPLLLTHVLDSSAIREDVKSVRDTSVTGRAQSVVQLQYVEVYGETIRDLLVDPTTHINPSRQNKLRLVTTTTTVADGLSSTKAGAQERDKVNTSPPFSAGLHTSCTLSGATVVPIYSVSDAAAVVAEGDARRATGATNVHEHSSRSHTILTLFHPRYACRLDLVDLAGSEREKKTGNTGVRFQESIAINTGLLALGNVIRALSRNHRAALAKKTNRTSRGNDSHTATAALAPAATTDAVGGGGGANTGSSTQHIPYRGSRLTRLLQDTLAGSSATLFIACVAPGTNNRDETLRTLQYCSLALQVRNAPIRQYDRLQRTQSRGPRPRAASESPSPDAYGGNGEGHTGRKGSDSNSPDGAALRVEELQAAYALLQQQYEEQGEVLASICESYAAAKERLEVWEKELSKDASLFTQEIRAMQQLVQENQRLRHRLLKAKSLAKRMAKENGGGGEEQRGDVIGGGPRGDGEAHARQRTLDAVVDATDEGEGHDDATFFLRDLLHRHDATHPANVQPPSSEDIVVVPREDERLPRTATATATAAQPSPLVVEQPRVPVSTLSPCRHLSFKSGSLLEDSQGDNTYAAPHADTASAATSEPVQSFIRSLLRQHGIFTGKDKAGIAAAAAAVSSPPVKSEDVTTTAPRDAALAHTPQTASPPLRDSNADLAALSSHPTAPSTSAEAVLVGRAGEEAPESPPSNLQRDVQLLQLASEVLRYEEANTDLRNQVRLLQVKLDDKSREAARLRLEVQDLKDVYSSLSAMTE